MAITVERIERALDKLAEVMLAIPNGDRCLPIYERLETELAAYRAKEDKMAAVRERAHRSETKAPDTMNTAFLLMAQYNGQAVIPIEDVCRDYFSLTVEIFLRKVAKGETQIPVVRMGSSQKAAKGIHLQDLAEYLDARRKDAHEELRQLTRP